MFVHVIPRTFCHVVRNRKQIRWEWREEARASEDCSSPVLITAPPAMEGDGGDPAIDSSASAEEPVVDVGAFYDA